MFSHARWFAAAAMAALVCGCSGASAVAPVSPAAAPRRPLVRATLRIIVPHRSHRRGARFVSPGTRSIAITLEPGSAGQQTFGFNVAAGTNAFSLELPPGTQTFDFQTYDGALDGGGNPTGHLLSANLGVPVTIVTAKANVISVVLEGVPAAVSVTPSNGQDVTGNAATGFDLVGAYEADGSTPYKRTFSAVATDADGNDILGDGAPQLAVASSNTAVVTSTAASGHNPNAFAITPSGSASVGGAATVTFTATPAASSGASAVALAVTMRVTALNAPRLYVTQENGTILAYDEAGYSIPLGNEFAALTGAVVGPIAYDPHDDAFYVVVSDTMDRFDRLGNLVYGAASASNVTALAYDGGTNQIYAGTFSAAVQVYDETPLAVSTGSWLEHGSGNPPGIPLGLVADAANGEIYVGDNAALSRGVQPFTTAGVAVANAQFFPNAPQIDGLAQDPTSGWLYLATAQASPNAVLVFDDAGNPVSTSGDFRGLASSAATAWNATNGRLYVVDQSNGGALAFDAEGNAVPAPGGFPGINSSLAGMVWVP